jgi:hypothetical protein
MDLLEPFNERLSGLADLGRGFRIKLLVRMVVPLEKNFYKRQKRLR